MPRASSFCGSGQEPFLNLPACPFPHPVATGHLYQPAPDKRIDGTGYRLTRTSRALLELTVRQPVPLLPPPPCLPQNNKQDPQFGVPKIRQNLVNHPCGNNCLPSDPSSPPPLLLAQEASFTGRESPLTGVGSEVPGSTGEGIAIGKAGSFPSLITSFFRNRSRIASAGSA